MKYSVPYNIVTIVQKVIHCIIIRSKYGIKFFVQCLVYEKNDFENREINNIYSFKFLNSIFSNLYNRLYLFCNHLFNCTTNHNTFSCKINQNKKTFNNSLKNIFKNFGKSTKDFWQ